MEFRFVALAVRGLATRRLATRREETMPDGLWNERRLAKMRTLIRQLYTVVAQLEEEFEDRRFTPDGHLVGSIGEVVAAYAFGLKLLPRLTSDTTPRLRTALQCKSNSREERRALASTASLFICWYFNSLATNSGRFTMAPEHPRGRVVVQSRKMLNVGSALQISGGSTAARAVNCPKCASFPSSIDTTRNYGGSWRCRFDCLPH